MSASCNLNNYPPFGHKLLFVIKKTMAHLFNIIKLGSDSAADVSLKHPGICSWPNNNTYLAQSAFPSALAILSWDVR